MKMPVAKWEIGQLVYLKANTDWSGYVTGFVVRAGSTLQYLVSYPGDGGEQSHFEFELSEDKPYGAIGEN